MTTDSTISDLERDCHVQAEYRLLQMGEVVAHVKGPRRGAWREIRHYAFCYNQDGPLVQIQERKGKKWVDFR